VYPKQIFNLLDFVQQIHFQKITFICILYFLEGIYFVSNKYQQSKDTHTLDTCKDSSLTALAVQSQSKQDRE
jgi:hypothetical protein